MIRANVTGRAPISDIKPLHRKAYVTCRARAQIMMKNGSRATSLLLCHARPCTSAHVCVHVIQKSRPHRQSKVQKNDITNCDRSITPICQNPKNRAEISQAQLMACHDLCVRLRTPIISSDDIHAHPSPQFKKLMNLRGIAGGICKSLRVLE